MKSFSVVLCLLVALFGWAQSVKIQFYDDANFTGLFHEIDSSELEGSFSTSCKSVPSAARNMLSSINTNGKCIMLYTSSSSCSLYTGDESVRIGPNEHHASDLSTLGFDNKANSFQLCNDEEGGEQLNVKLYQSAKRKDDLVSYTNLCGCVDLPSFAAGNVSSVDNGGNCMMLYTGEGCSGTNLILPGGRSAASEDLSTSEIGIATKSIGVCNPGQFRHTCMKLSASIFNVAVTFPPMRSLEEAEASSEMVSIAPKTVYTNKASHTSVSQQYTAATTIHEGVTVDRSAFIGSQISVEVQPDLVVDTDAEAIQLLGRHSIQPIFASAFEDINVNSSAIYVHQSDREVKVNQQVNIESCTKYTVSSSVAVIHDHPLNYAVTSKVSGEYGGIPMSAAELKARLAEFGLEHVEDDADEEGTVIAKAVGSMKATFSHATLVSGEEAQVEDCVPREDGTTSAPSSSTRDFESGDNYDDDDFAIYYSKAGATTILIMAIIAAMGILFTITQLFMIMRVLQAEQRRIPASSQQFGAHYMK